MYSKLSSPTLTFSLVHNGCNAYALAEIGCVDGALSSSSGKDGGRGTGGRGRLRCIYFEDRCWNKHGKPPSGTSFP